MKKRKGTRSKGQSLNFIHKIKPEDVGQQETMTTDNGLQIEVSSLLGEILPEQIGKLIYLSDSKITSLMKG